MAVVQKESQSFTLKIFVLKEENKVLFAEANQEFIDVLFSFVTMPIGTLTKLIHERPSAEGTKISKCLKNLYESVENFDDEMVQNKKCRALLLHPRSAAELYCRNLKLNLVDSDNYEYYVCRSGRCQFVSYSNLGKCPCGDGFKQMIKLSDTSFLSQGGVFLKSTLRFMIMDDLKVLPISIVAALSELSKLGEYGKIEERTITIGRDEVLKLLECSMTSETPLSDTFLEPSPVRKPMHKSSEIAKWLESLTLKTALVDTSFEPPIIRKPMPKTFLGKLFARKIMDQPLKLGKDAKNTVEDIHFKLIFDKARNKALYAEVKEDFVSLICSFLAFPLGYVFHHQFPRLSFKGSINNLCKSIQDIDVNFFCSEDMKKILAEPKVAPGFVFNNHLPSIGQVSSPSWATLSHLCMAERVNFSLEPCQGEELLKGPSIFMVTDNLEITPLSLSSAISFINYKVPISDIGELELTMGPDEALHLLMSSVVSKHALTNTFLVKEPGTIDTSLLKEQRNTHTSLPKEQRIGCLGFRQFFHGDKGKYERQ